MGLNFNTSSDLTKLVIFVHLLKKEPERIIFNRRCLFHTFNVYMFHNFQAKLDGYRENARRGKPLNEDQKAAVAKYDEVMQTAEFAKDMVVQLKGLAAEEEKAGKKKAKKDAADKAKADVSRLALFSFTLKIAHGDALGEWQKCHNKPTSPKYLIQTTSDFYCIIVTHKK